MSDYMTDEQRIEEIKKWWTKYGNMVSTIVMLGLACIVGYKIWHNHNVNVRTQASMVYEQMMSSTQRNDHNAVQAHATTLIKDFTSTPYASLAQFIMAREAVYKGELPSALKDLHWVIDNSKDKNLRQVARLRSARLFLADAKYQQALEIVKLLEVKTFMPAVAEIRGDIYLAMGDKPKAVKQYQLALQNNATVGMVKPLLRMKLQNLDGNDHSVATIATKETV